MMTRNGGNDMAIDTTLYVHETTIELIDSACAIMGCSRSRAIVMLFRRAMADRRKRPNTGSAIRYQRRDALRRWRTVHVRFREDEADYVKDMRNFFKLSDSLILAQAARQYLDDVVKQSCRDGKSDNYRFPNYILARYIEDGLTCWLVCWGIPHSPLLRTLFRSIARDKI